MDIGRGLVLAAGLMLLSACSRSARDTMPELRLPTLSSRPGASLASCPTVKCLTVYVAPWCGYCRAATPAIIALRRFLRERGIATRIVVGMAGLGEVREYASVFGPDTLLDPEGALRVGGVPHFYVSNQAGAVLRDVPGAPAGAGSVEEFASYYDLP